MCAFCGEDSRPHGKLGWHKAGGGEAKWLEGQSIVDAFLGRPHGFFVDVPIPENCVHVWTAAHLTPSYAGLPRDARLAYTGRRNGRAIPHTMSFPEGKITGGTVVRLRAPIPYRDTDGQMYPPHVHALIKAKRRTQVLTLPFLVPECGHATAVRARRSNWAIIYVLADFKRNKQYALPGTVHLTSAKAIHRAFSKTPNKPLLLYCANAECNASHKIAKDLMKIYGHTLVAVYRGGMRELQSHNDKKKKIK